MKKINLNKYVIIVFLASFIPRVILCLSTVPVRTISDEVSTISWAAYFAGLDWSEVVSNAGYYGFGMAMLFAPLYNMLSDPIVIYRIMVMGCSVLQSLVAVIAYRIMKTKFRIKSEIFSCIVAIVCSFMVVTRGLIVYNESALIFITWVIAYLLLELHKNVDTRRKKLFLTILLSIVFAYSLTIHTRAITYVAAMFGLIIIYFWIYRKWLVSLPYIVSLTIVGYIGSKKIIYLLQSAVWLSQDGGKIRNATVSTSGLQHLFNPECWFAWLSIVLGQLNTISVFTGGVILFTIVIFIAMLVKFVFRRKKFIIEAGQNDNGIYVVLSTYFLICVVITIFGQSLSWLYQLVLAIGEGYGSQAYAFKAVTYVRYFGPYLGPLLLIGLVFIYNCPDKIKKYLSVVIAAFFGLQIFWNGCIIPYVHGNAVANEVYLPFFLGNNYEIETRFLSYFCGTVVSSFLFILFCVLIIKKRMKLLVSILLVLLSYEYIYNAIYIDRNVAVHNYEQIDKTYELLSEIEKNMKLPYEIYVDDARSGITNDQIFYQYQLYMFKHKIRIGIPEKKYDDMIVISNSTYNKQQLLDRGYLCTKLDDKEYLFVKGEQIQEAIFDEGIKLYNYLVFDERYDGDEILTGLYRDEDGNPISEGEEGTLAYGPYLFLDGGTYEVEFDLEMIDNNQGNTYIGTCDVYSIENDIMFQAQILDSDFDKENSTIKIVFTTETIEDIEFRVFTNSGSNIKIDSIKCKKIAS